MGFRVQVLHWVVGSLDFLWGLPTTVVGWGEIEVAFLVGTVFEVLLKVYCGLWWDFLWAFLRGYRGLLL